MRKKKAKETEEDVAAGKRKVVLQETKLFGVSLDVVMKRAHETGIVPQVVKKILHFLKNATILRNPTVFTSVQPSSSASPKLLDLIKMCNRQPIDVNFREFKHRPHYIGALLLYFFRKLPEPIFSDAIIQKMSTETVKKRGSKISALKYMIAKKSIADYCLLLLISRYLHMLIENAEFNAHTPATLALLFAPYLLHITPKKTPPAVIHQSKHNPHSQPLALPQQPSRWIRSILCNSSSHITLRSSPQPPPHSSSTPSNHARSRMNSAGAKASCLK
eukprot:TRINITY_DN5021_c0_g1_i1.p1 TRINITY_DN5021_c0_g1~~TRINITY_DN5021_c0_g1_i1.p1  ORF type:complete len:275 (+),score=33.62 TRINITY_DN5021_c0_g1_i1:52-876(+)